MSATTASAPPNLAAIIPEPHARLTLTTLPIPSPGPDELVVLNHAIAANPVDWKIQDYNFFVQTYPSVLGSDVCGQVVAVGDAVTRFKKGDRVTGFAAVLYNDKIDHGAWQTYTVLREIATTKIPDRMSWEEGSIFPMAFATAAVGLFSSLGLPRSPHSAGEAGVLLVWGAGSCVGSAAIQIAHAFGYTVFGTASRKNFSWIEKLGVDQLFDYHDEDVVDQIVAAAEAREKTIDMAFDAVSQGDTLDQVPEAVRRSAPKDKGKVTYVLFWPEGKEQPKGVEMILTRALQTGVDEAEMGKWFFNEWLQGALEDGTVVPAPRIEVVQGGLEVTQKVFDDLKAGVSGKKFVMKLKE